MQCGYMSSTWRSQMLRPGARIYRYKRRRSILYVADNFTLFIPLLATVNTVGAECCERKSGRILQTKSEGINRLRKVLAGPAPFSSRLRTKECLQRKKRRLCGRPYRCSGHGTQAIRRFSKKRRIDRDQFFKTPPPQTSPTAIYRMHAKGRNFGAP